MKRFYIKTEIKDGQTFAVTYNQDNSGNYNSVSGFFTVNVTKATGKINAQNQTFVYTGSEIKFVATTNNTDGVELKYSITSDKGNSTILLVDTYYIDITLDASEHFTGTTKSIKVSVTKATPSLENNVFNNLFEDEIDHSNYASYFNQVKANVDGVLTIVSTNYSLTIPAGWS